MLLFVLVVVFMGFQGATAQSIITCESCFNATTTNTNTTWCPISNQCVPSPNLIPECRNWMVTQGTGCDNIDYLSDCHNLFPRSNRAWLQPSATFCNPGLDALLQEAGLTTNRPLRSFILFLAVMRFFLALAAGFVECRLKPNKQEETLEDIELDKPSQHQPTVMVTNHGWISCQNAEIVEYRYLCAPLADSANRQVHRTVFKKGMFLFITTVLIPIIFLVKYGLESQVISQVALGDTWPPDPSASPCDGERLKWPDEAGMFLPSGMHTLYLSDVTEINEKIALCGSPDFTNLKQLISAHNYNSPFGAEFAGLWVFILGMCCGGMILFCCCCPYNTGCCGCSCCPSIPDKFRSCWYASFVSMAMVAIAPAALAVAVYYNHFDATINVVPISSQIFLNPDNSRGAQLFLVSMLSIPIPRLVDAVQWITTVVEFVVVLVMMGSHSFRCTSFCCN